MIIVAIVSLTSVSDIFMGLMIAFASWTSNLIAEVVTDEQVRLELAGADDFPASVLEKTFQAGGRCQVNEHS